MIKITKFILIATITVFALGINVNVMAQEDTTTATVETQISAQDLGVSNQNLLPNSPLYFLKEWGRSVRLAFTFNDVKKAELANKFSNEKLVELRKMAEDGVDPEKIEKATESYQKSVEKIKNIADKIKDKAENNPDVNKFLEKFTNQQVLQEKILQKLETQVPEEVLEKIKAAREAHIERFQEVMTKLEDNKDNIAEKVKNALQNGDEINSEILDKIKEKMPEEVRQKIEATKTEVMNKVIERINQSNPAGVDCPNVMIADTTTFCPNGKIKAEKDSNGCVIKVNCVLPPGYGMTGCERGTMWDSNQNKCVNCPEGTYPVLSGPVWKCDKKMCEKDSDCPNVCASCGTPDTTQKYVECLKACVKMQCVNGKCVPSSNIKTSSSCIGEGKLGEKKQGSPSNCCAGLKEQAYAQTASIPGSILYKCIKPEIEGKAEIEQRCINQKCQANGATCDFDYQCPPRTDILQVNP